MYDLYLALPDARVSLIFFHPVFWALRGGGAGSWGVIIDATLPLLPIFNATIHTVNILTTTLNQTASLMTTHAKHISDLDQVRAGQYFTLMGSTTNSTLTVSTYFKDLDGDTSKAQVSPFLADAAKLGAAVQGETTVTSFANDIVGSPDDMSKYNEVLSSRLIPGSVYSSAPESVGFAYKQLLSRGIQFSVGLLVAGGAFHSSQRYSMVLFQVHHSRRPSDYQCRNRFRSEPCMALSKDPCEHYS